MKWTVSFHPAVAGEIEGMPLSAAMVLLPTLLRLQLDGGASCDNAGLPTALLKDKAALSYRFLTCPGDHVVALGCSFVNASICVVSLASRHGQEDEAAFNTFGRSVAERYQNIIEAVVTPVSIREAMSWFPSDAVIVAEAAAQAESHRVTCLERVLSAQGEMREELSDLYNLSETQRRRLERKHDFVLETLRKKLVPHKASVALTIRFPEGVVFESEGLAALETL